MTECRYLHFFLLDPPIFFKAITMFQLFVIESAIKLFPFKDIFFYNLLAVIYDKKFLTCMISV